jgi:hypothetical protein
MIPFTHILTLTLTLILTYLGSQFVLAEVGARSWGCFLQGGLSKRTLAAYLVDDQNKHIHTYTHTHINIR